MNLEPDDLERVASRLERRGEAETVVSDADASSEEVRALYLATTELKDGDVERMLINSRVELSERAVRDSVRRIQEVLAASEDVSDSRGGEDGTSERADSVRRSTSERT